MADPNELLRTGDLDGARAALVELVRSKPQDPPTRMFLFQLFAVLGEWDKAKLQLETLAKLSEGAAMLAVAYGQAIDAERIRNRAFQGEIDVHVHVGAAGWVNLLAQSIGCHCRGDHAHGNELRDAAFDQAGDTPGEIDGIAFDWIANADARFGPAFEAIIGGTWGIVPFDAVERIECAGVRDLRDIVWFPVQVAFKSGQSVAAMLPARYPGTEISGNAAERLARATSWSDSAAGGTGIGQQIFSLSSGSDVDLLSLRLLKFD